MEALRELPDNSIDSVVTDPPYGLSNSTPEKVQQAIRAWVGGERGYVPHGKGFMDLEWDSFVPPPAVWDECYRVLKPGGMMAVFSGARTQDTMGISIRLAGFEVVEYLDWIYGSGFPKSLNVAKAIDKAAGKRGHSGKAFNVAGDYGGRNLQRSREYDDPPLVTEEAKKWDGWGTALKPAHEPIIILRKPAGDESEGNNRPLQSFLYQAKASVKERPTIEKDCGTVVSHPTVKPLRLMEWLCSLVTPEGGTVLDPFAGSGSTLEAAKRNGMSFIGVEFQEDYVRLCEKRLAGT